MEQSTDDPAERPRVLVMDDEESIREILAILLPRQGFDITTVRDGREAIDCYKTAMSGGSPFAVAVLDLTVPGGMGGVDTLQVLREMDPNVRAIVVSGHAGGRMNDEYKSLGFVDVVAKPFQVPDLAEVIRRNLP